MTKMNRKKGKRYPKLSNIDQLIYKSIGVSLIISDVLIIWLSYFSIMCKKYFTDDVLAVENSNLLVLTLPLSLYLLIVGCICLRTQKPLFGNPKINYSNLKSRYEQVVPVFDKRYINKKSVIEFCLKGIGFLAVGIVVVVLFNFHITSRYELTKNGINKYNVCNHQTAHYDYDDINEYNLYVNTVRYGFLNTPLFKHDAELYMCLTLKNGEMIFLGSENFKDVASLREVDKLLQSKNKSVESAGLDTYIKCRSFSAEEEKIIREIFTN